MKKDYYCEMVNYEDLPNEVEKANLSNNGCGKEYARYLLIWHKGKLFNHYSDAMEPEDVAFYRDLDWIGPALEEAYALGKLERQEVG